MALTWLYLYQRQRHWKRVELARQEVKIFQERQSIKNVLNILDYEEFRTFYITHPRDGRLVSFEANGLSAPACPSLPTTKWLRPDGGWTKSSAWRRKPKPLIPKPWILSKNIDDEEFFIELTLRDWFDSFLGGVGLLQYPD